MCDAGLVASIAVHELFERDAELAELRSALQDARSGAGRLVVIEGEAGIGKTGLVAAASEEAGEAGLRALGARGTELERDFPFALIRQLFEPVLVAAGPDERRELLAGLARPAGPVVGVEPEEEGAPSPAESLLDPSFATLNALFWLLSNLAESRPLLLAVDDAHWSDRASLQFLRFLLPRLPDLPVALVVAARPAEPGAEVELLAGLSTDPAARVLRPRALGPDAVAQMVRDALGAQADDAFCAACHETTGGSPFLLRELLGELRAQDSTGAAADVARVAEVAPSAIQQAVLVRLAGLPGEARALARAVAVLGDDADVRAAAALAGIEPEAAGAPVDSLVAAGILEPTRPLRFRHPLLRNAVHADIPPMELAAAHAEAARLVAAAGGEPERVAVHLLGVEPAGDPEVVETLAAAAQRALDRAAPDAALRYVRRALAEPAGRDVRPRLVGQLITAAVRAGDSSPVEDLHIDPAAELGQDPDVLVDSAWQLAMGMMSQGRLDEMAPLLEQAVARASERGQPELALRLEALLASSSLLSPRDARARFERHADGIQPGSPSERLWLALQSWWGMFLGDTPDRCAELAAAALSDGRIYVEQAESPPPGQAILVLARTERLDLAAEQIEAMAKQARDSGSATGLSQASYLRAYVEWLRGEVARAEADAAAALESARRGGYLAGVPVFIAIHLDTLVERDELDAADSSLEELGLAGPLPDNYWWTALTVSRARLRLAQRRWDEAADDLRAITAANDRDGISHPFYGLDSLLALALAGRDEGDEARALAAQELERAREWGVPSVVGPALRAVGLLAEREEGLAVLEEAVAVLEGSGVRLEYMRALCDHGAALRRANRRADAREPLRAALELARRGGAVAIARRAFAELEATGERPRELMATGVESLTPSERRVAELAAEGLTNREVAQALFLTVKTVEMHLSRAYRKLDIGSRRELGDALGGE